MGRGGGGGGGKLKVKLLFRDDSHSLLSSRFLTLSPHLLLLPRLPSSLLGKPNWDREKPDVRTRRFKKICLNGYKIYNKVSEKF